METSNEDDDLKLVRASAGLLSDLEAALPKVLWQPSSITHKRGRVHTRVKQRDVEYIVRLIEPFQGEPQLLDAKLKLILPAISEAYTEYLGLNFSVKRTQHVDFQTAICIILYTLCKVRGYKIVLGFLNNEPRYLEPILQRIEDILAAGPESRTDWQVPYVLLLWLAHLTLTPFDLSSISDDRRSNDTFIDSLPVRGRLPAIAQRTLVIGWNYLSIPTKAQDAAAMLLVRLLARPDMQKLQLADAVVAKVQALLQVQSSDVPVTIYERIGPLRFLAGLANSSEFGHLIPDIYNTCTKLSEEEQSSVAANAVAKKLLVKIYRNIVTLSLHSACTQNVFAEFLEKTSVLEEVIDYSLRSLGDRDTPVRYAAAKALSQIILELETDMSHEVIQAILDALKEDIPRNGESTDFRQVDALRWHGLTLALAHVLFKRSASPQQLSDIVNALTSALQFEQRTATGSSVGTNVRDAANFGIWSLSRRYTTKELFSVDTGDLNVPVTAEEPPSVIQWLAIQLLLSACLDPAGNIRRGSSAALQELIGRHPDQIHEGIALVQIVDYHAVGLRRRAMTDVVGRAAELHKMYWTALVSALFDWRGLGSPDVSSREAAAASLASLSSSQSHHDQTVLLEATRRLRVCTRSDVEDLHGLVLLLALLIKGSEKATGASLSVNGKWKISQLVHFNDVLKILLDSTSDFSLRNLRSELPSAMAEMLAALCQALSTSSQSDENAVRALLDTVDILTERVLTRHEETIQQAIPPLVTASLVLKHHTKAPLSIIGAQQLSKRVALDGSKSTLHGAGRAIALGGLTPMYDNGLVGEKALAALTTLSDLTGAMNVDWRVIGIKAIQISIEYSDGNQACESNHAGNIFRAVHCGANDYTIDERGDVGSLVRLQAIACMRFIFAHTAFEPFTDKLKVLQGDILRLSLEKLDRVRLAAAQCQHEYMSFALNTDDVASVSSFQYFSEGLRHLTVSEEHVEEPYYRQIALLEGCISCAGISAEPLLQASRAALVQQLYATDSRQLQRIMTSFAIILKSVLVSDKTIHPALELLAFLFDMQIPQRIDESEFKWRDLLSTVQKSHFKSNDLPKILAAVHVYRGMAAIGKVRQEVLKKLISMLKTSPYPKVRASVAEHLYMITDATELEDRDWTKPLSLHGETIRQLEARYLNN